VPEGERRVPFYSLVLCLISSSVWEVHEFYSLLCFLFFVCPVFFFRYVPVPLMIESNPSHGGRFSYCRLVLCFSRGSSRCALVIFPMGENTTAFLPQIDRYLSLLFWTFFSTGAVARGFSPFRHLGVHTLPFLQKGIPHTPPLPR